MGSYSTKETKGKKEITCIQLSKSAKKRLDSFAKERRETYESIIIRLMDCDELEKNRPCGEEKP